MARLNFLQNSSIKPFKFIKKFMPVTLFGRALVIMIVPVLLVQLIMGIVYWNRHWYETTEILAHGIAGNVASLTEIADKTAISDAEFTKLQQLAYKNHDIKLSRKPLATGFEKGLLVRGDWRELFLKNALASKVEYQSQSKLYKDTILIQVAGEKYMYSFKFSKSRLLPKTIYIVVLWEVGAPLFFILIAIIFMRNQMRPLEVLANAVEDFGKGRDIGEFRPSGALEVRRVGRAFNSMRDRIYKQISQRTEMLAGISHDIKTPLTRMKLELAMLNDSEPKDEMLADIKEMEKMVGEYLAFAKGQETEKETQVDLGALIVDIFEKFPIDKVHISSMETAAEIEVALRYVSMKRALINIIANALRYADNVWFQCSATAKTITLVFEDDGPGIPEEKRGDVFRPFVRLDESRNIETGGYGLGLSICRDIITSHGGRIFLEESYSLGGLKVVVSLPL